MVKKLKVGLKDYSGAKDLVKFLREFFESSVNCDVEFFESGDVFDWFLSKLESGDLVDFGYGGDGIFKEIFGKYFEESSESSGDSFRESVDMFREIKIRGILEKLEV
jgi:hypothetical protein